MVRAVRDRSDSMVVGHVELSRVGYPLPDGRALLEEVSFRVGEGAKVALVGANGAGKTTLLRIVAGELAAHSGAVTRSGGLGVMRQFVGTAWAEQAGGAPGGRTGATPRCATCSSRSPTRGCARPRAPWMPPSWR